MPLIFQKAITANDIRENPDWLYLFGDNEQRRGYGGQAAIARGFPNAVGIATKSAPTREDYWSDDDFDRCAAILDRDFARAFVHILEGGTVVCPSAGLGTGLAELPTRAPRVFAYLRKLVKQLKKDGECTPACPGRAEMMGSTDG